MECIFCKISKKESPANILFEDDLCLAIKPIDQISKGHVLVIPKEHCVNILDIDSSLLSHITVVSKTIGEKLMLEYEADGLNLLHAAGADAQQSVFHFHFHLVPRYKEDQLDLWFRNSL
jgi:histidine triad (HIT) family protein